MEEVVDNRCAKCGAEDVKFNLTLQFTQVDRDATKGDLYVHHGPESRVKILNFCDAHKPDVDGLIGTLQAAETQKKIYQIEIHVKERADSTADNRLFDCWVAGDGADRLDYFVRETYPEGLCQLQPALGSGKSIRYIAEVEKMAWLWSLEINKHVEQPEQPVRLAEMHVTRVQELIF